MRTVLNSFIFLLLVLAFFIYVGKTITDITGGERNDGGGSVEVTPEGGEAIFWGKGRCFTCHSMGDEGSNVRGPNLGVFGEKFPLPIGARASERAKERSRQTGQKYSATDYLVESLAGPGAYVVDSYKNEMTIVYAPPILLSFDEIKAVISYLQSQGGDVDLGAINNPSEVAKKFYDRISAASAAGGGDPGNGVVVFKDNCSECHTINGEGGKIGPDLSAVGKKGVKFIAASILKPAGAFTEGYETYVVINKEGRRFVGVKSRDDAAEIDITKANGEVVTIARSDIQKIKTDENKSIMPEDLIEILTVKDYHDVLAYLLMQKGQK